MVHQPKNTAKGGLNKIKKDKRKLGRIKKNNGKIKDGKQEISKSPHSSIIRVRLQKGGKTLHNETSASDVASMITKEIKRRYRKNTDKFSTIPKINHPKPNQSRNKTLKYERLSVKSYSTNFTITSSRVAAATKPKSLKRKNVKAEIRTVEELKRDLFEEFQKAGVFGAIEERRGMSHNLKGMIEGGNFSVPVKSRQGKKPRNLKIICETTGRITKKIKTPKITVDDSQNDKLREGILLKSLKRNEAQQRHFDSLTKNDSLSRLMQHKTMTKHVSYKSPVIETSSSSKNIIPLRKAAYTNFRDYKVTNVKKAVSLNELTSTSKSSLQSQSSLFLSVKSGKASAEDTKQLDLQEIHHLIDLLQTSIANLENDSSHELLKIVPNNSETKNLNTIYSSQSVWDKKTERTSSEIFPMSAEASKEKITEGVTMQGINVTSVQGKNITSTQGTNVSLVETKHITSEIKNPQTKSQELLKSYLQDAQIINDKLTKKMEDFEYGDEPHHPVFDIVIRLDNLHKRLQKFLEQRTNV